MFVRFRETRSRLQLSLIETRRVDGKPRHEHLASLGSIALAPTVADRIVFWAKLHERLGKLSNRFSGEQSGKVMGEVNARIPMPTPDEQRALQLENAKVDARQWAAVRDLTESDIASRAKLVEQHEAVIAAARPVVDTASEREQAAQGRVAAIERGEVVEGLGTPQEFLALLKALGWTDADLRHACWMANAVREERFKEFVAETVRLARKGERRRDKQALRAILRRHGDGA